MSGSNIIILSAPVHFGKTTALMNWIKTTDHVGGILTPDINSLRMLCRVRDDELFPFQIKEDENIKSHDCILVGKYKFYRQSFELAQSILKEDFSNKLSYVLIDELGKLEMKGKGLEPVISKLIEKARRQADVKLIIVIRDYLLNEAIIKFKLENASIIKLDESLSIKL